MHLQLSTSWFTHSQRMHANKPNRFTLCLSLEQFVTQFVGVLAKSPRVVVFLQSKSTCWLVTRHSTLVPATASPYHAASTQHHSTQWLTLWSGQHQTNRSTWWLLFRSLSTRGSAFPSSSTTTRSTTSTWEYRVFKVDGINLLKYSHLAANWEGPCWYPHHAVPTSMVSMYSLDGILALLTLDDSIFVDMWSVTKPTEFTIIIKSS